MSENDIGEMKELVTDALDKNGTLGQFKAQLRSSIITVLQSQDKELFKKDNMPNSTAEGTLMLELIQEFLTNYNLKYTSSVFVPETGCPTTCRTRSQLSKELGLDEDSNGPLLMQLLNRRHSGPPLSPENGHIHIKNRPDHDTSFSPPERPRHGISRATVNNDDDDYNFTSFQKPTLPLSDYRIESPPLPKGNSSDIDDILDNYGDDFEDNDKIETPVKQPTLPTVNTNLEEEARSDDSLLYDDKSVTESEIEKLRDTYSYVEKLEDRIERDSDDDNY